MSHLRDSIHHRVHHRFFGEIVFVNFFISVPDAEWTEVKRQNVFNILWECKHFFEAKGIENNVILDIRPTYYYDVWDDYYPYVNRSLSKQEMEEWIERIFRNTGFQSHDSAITYLKQNLGREPVFLFHYMLEGCSYCLHEDWEYRVTILYYSHNGNIEKKQFKISDRDHEDCGIYAHEILHIFGANDLYHSQIEVGNLMNTHYWQLHLNYISKNTCKEIGWV